MAKFTKKPITIEAVQLLWSAWGEMCEHAGVGNLEDGKPEGRPMVDGKISLAIPTLEGVMIASEGDWIIRGVKGELYPCKPDIFAATYSEAEDPGAVDMIDRARRTYAVGSPEAYDAKIRSNREYERAHGVPVPKLLGRIEYALAKADDGGGDDRALAGAWGDIAEIVERLRLARMRLHQDDAEAATRLIDELAAAVGIL